MGEQAAVTFWELLRSLRRARGVPAACFKLFAWLWSLTVSDADPAGAPDHLCVAIRWAADELGRDPRSVRQTLERLDELGLIEIVDRDRRRGTYSIYIWRPNPGGKRPPRPDLQQQLPIMDGSELELSGEGPEITPPGSLGQGIFDPHEKPQLGVEDRDQLEFEPNKGPLIEKMAHAIGVRIGHGQEEADPSILGQVAEAAIDGSFAWKRVVRIIRRLQADMQRAPIEQPLAFFIRSLERANFRFKPAAGRRGRREKTNNGQAREDAG